MLDFVPLAGSGRQVAGPRVEDEFVGQLLQFAFPQPHPRAVAAAAPGLRRGGLGSDQQSGRLAIAQPPDGELPLADAINGERRRIKVKADSHPTRIGGEVVDPVRHRAAGLPDQEVMDPALFWVALGRYSRPLLRKSPTIPFLASTKITGCFSANAV